MEKTVSFSILKEKIIKTDELLSVVLEKNQSVEKSQKWNHHLKTRLELTKNEVSKLKLRNETLACNLTSTEKNYETLKNEHNQLKERFTQLETESGNTINNLQVNYQLANKDLEECQQQLCVFNATKEPVNDQIKRKKSPVRRRKSPIKKKVDEDESDLASVLKQVSNLKAEKEKLLNEKADLQLEIYEVKKKFSGLHLVQDNYAKLEAELTQRKSGFSASIEKKDKEIERLSKEIKIVEKQKAELAAENEKLKGKSSLPELILEDSNEVANTTDREIRRLSEDVKKLESDNRNLLTENEKLKFQNSSFPEVTLESRSEKSENEIIKLKSEIETKDKEIKTLSRSVKKIELENERLRDKNNSYQIEIAMLQENSSQKSEEVDDFTFDKNTRKERVRTDSVSPTDEEIAAIMKEMYVPQEISPFTSPAVEDYPENPGLENEVPACIENHLESSPVSDDLKKVVSRRRNLIKKMKQIARKRRKNVDLFGTLLALKKANINFIISNNSLLSPNQNQKQLNYIYPKKVKVKDKPKTAVTVTKELSCKLSCCKNSYMILKDDSKDAPLLGFVGVKKEISVQKENLDNRGSCLRPKNLQTFKKRKLIEETESFDDTCESVSDSSEIVPQDDHNENDFQEAVQNEIDNDEGYQSYQSGSASSSPRSESESTVRRSKRKSSSLLSVIKKRKVSNSKSNKLAITNCVDISRKEVREKSTIKKNIVSAETVKNNRSEEFVFKKPISVPKSPKTTFKRPVCTTRRSQRLVSREHNEVVPETENQEEKREEITVESPQSPTPESAEESEEIPVQTPQSPTPESKENIKNKPMVIPLEKIPETVERMPPSKIEVLFNKLILYSEEEEVLNEVVREFAFQEPEYIAEAILERVSLDYHDRADTKYSPAPLMTAVQRTMLGFMSKLEKSNVIGVLDSYLTLAEQKLLTCNDLQEFEPVTRLYLSVCKLRKNLTRMRKLCCDVFYFCGDLAVPFLFTVLTSWTEVLPHEAESKDFPIARVLVQIIYMKDCNKPGYNLMPLRDLLIKFYGYPTERWDCNEFFKELFDRYLKNPTRSSDFALLLYCKNRPEKWVFEKIEEHLKPLINLKIQDNFKATLIILISNLYNRFSSKSEVNYLPRIREWLSSLVNDETPDVMKRCVYVSMIRLKKK